MRQDKLAIDKQSTDQELMDAFETGNNAGQGYGLGEETGTPFEAADREGYTILRRIEGGTNNPGEPVFCCNRGGDLIVVANINGPWAVVVGLA